MNAQSNIIRGVRPIDPAMLASIVPGHFGAPRTLSGPLPVYHEHGHNHCPGCSRSQWLVGRTTAECFFCGTALPLAATFQSQDAALERPRLVHGKTEPRHTEIRLNARKVAA